MSTIHVFWDLIFILLKRVLRELEFFANIRTYYTLLCRVVPICFGTRIKLSGLIYVVLRSRVFGLKPPFPLEPGSNREAYCRLSLNLYGFCGFIHIEFMTIISGSSLSLIPLPLVLA